MLDIANVILVTLIVVAVLAMIFAKQVYAVLLYIGRMNKTHDGIKIMRSQNYIDIETGESFKKWSLVRGLKADAIAAFTRF